MLKANEVTPRNVKNVIPEICKGRTYIECVEGMGLRITGAAINRYIAKDKDNQERTTQDGRSILNRVAYVLIEGGFYSSFKGYTAIEQIISCAPDVLESDEVGTVEVPEFPEVVPVGIIKVSEQMGKERYDYLAFEPQ